MSEEKMLEQWDRVSAAIDRVITALPGQMTEASARLEDERRKMRDAINTWAFRQRSPQPDQASGTGE